MHIVESLTRCWSKVALSSFAVSGQTSETLHMKKAADTQLEYLGFLMRKCIHSSLKDQVKYSAIALAGIPRSPRQSQLGPSLIRSCLKKQSFRQCAPQSEFLAQCGLCHPVLAFQELLGFFWGVLRELCNTTCPRMGFLFSLQSG
jgi:hypothetical protein